MLPGWLVAVGVVEAVFLAGFVFLVSAAVGYLGGRLGGWLAGKAGRREGAAAGT